MDSSCLSGILLAERLPLALVSLELPVFLVREVTPEVLPLLVVRQDLHTWITGK